MKGKKYEQALEVAKKRRGKEMDRGEGVVMKKSAQRHQTALKDKQDLLHKMSYKLIVRNEHRHCGRERSF
jgi:hypothetical protein